MVSVCPSEGDPRLTVEKFVSDNSIRAIGGLRAEGLVSLMKIVSEEVKRQDPKSNLMFLNRDSLDDVCFLKELTAYLEPKLDNKRMNNVIISEELPINEWQNAFPPLKEKYQIQVYFGSQACRQIPMCAKLF